ncbi:CAP domain-containing protein [Iningainema tapete]|uniref:CAP domain-containing protein n=1 Tax=Iningainema tapete BLCC-T55 TaxID=2748662 RepID=A0A8J6XAB5_9CYAN|nr:CAP domain-containing protein [Iningainema tapete]MBD2771080.1 CAP domain-containing protein [Iningainema tapete BLCC-T55]
MAVNSVNQILTRSNNSDLQSYNSVQVLSPGLGSADPLSAPINPLNSASSSQDNVHTSSPRRLRDIFNLNLFSPKRSDTNIAGSTNTVNNSAPLSNSNNASAANTVNNSAPLSNSNNASAANIVTNSAPIEANKQVQTSNVQPIVPLSSQPAVNPLVQEVVNLTNAQRQLVGLQPLQLNFQLNNSAQAHAQDMAVRDFFDHVGSNGTGIGDRAKAAGYTYSFIGENIGAGQATAQGIVSSWMNSPGHKAQILNPNYREIGVGYYYLANDTGKVNYNHYWTVGFGKVL